MSRDVIGHVTIRFPRPFSICFFREFFGTTHRKAAIFSYRRQTGGINKVSATAFQGFAVSRVLCGFDNSQMSQASIEYLLCLASVVISQT